MLRQPRERELQRDEEQREHEEVEAEPVQADVTGALDRSGDFVLRAAEQERGDRESDRDEPERHAPAQHDAEGSQAKRADEDEVDEEAHVVHRIDRARVGGREECRKPQTQHGTERERREHDADDSADPPAPEPMLVRPHRHEVRARASPAQSCCWGEAE